MQKDLCPTTTVVLEAGSPEGTHGDLAELQRKYNLLQGEVIRLQAAQDKTGDRAPIQLEKQLQELRLKDTVETRDTLISQETAVQVDGVQEDGKMAIFPRAESPRGESS